MMRPIVRKAPSSALLRPPQPRCDNKILAPAYEAKPPVDPRTGGRVNTTIPMTAAVDRMHRVHLATHTHGNAAPVCSWNISARLT